MMDYSKIRRDYVHDPLSADEMDKDPFIQFRNWFDEAYKVFDQDTNTMALATADSKGRPSVRMVLLKGLTEEGFLFFTDYEGRKGGELARNPQAALLFFWPGMDRQVRIEGQVRKTSVQKSDEYFDSRPLGSRMSAIASHQSEKTTMAELEAARDRVEQTGDLSRPARWGGFELIPDYFEFWQGKKNRFHDRMIYDRRDKTEYEIYRIAP